MKGPGNTFGWVMLLAALLLIIWLIQGALLYAQSPTVLIAPNGGITYVYPGTPSVAIAPNGGVTYIYPGTVAPPAPVLPPILTPLPSYSYGGK